MEELWARGRRRPENIIVEVTHCGWEFVLVIIKVLHCFRILNTFLAEIYLPLK